MSQQNKLQLIDKNPITSGLSNVQGQLLIIVYFIISVLCFKIQK